MAYISGTAVPTNGLLAGMRYCPFPLTGLALPVVSEGLTGSNRSIFPNGVVRFCAFPPGSRWLGPTSLELPPSPSARYMNPSGPYAIVPPLWLPAFFPKEMTSRRVVGSITFGLVALTLNSFTTLRKFCGAVVPALGFGYVVTDPFGWLLNVYSVRKPTLVGSL
jgi:hypothetical protein